MNQLPNHPTLEIGKLSSVFSDTTNSYKFYWFLAILDSIKENHKSLIPKNELALRMVASVWYPLDYYKLSFGKQDSFKGIARHVSELLEIDNSVNSKSLFEQINTKLNPSEVKSINTMIPNTLLGYVPYRFVRPFFSSETVGLLDAKVNSVVKETSNQRFTQQPERIIYRFIEESIELNTIWFEYFQTHQTILRGFIYWHLLRFLHKHNDNVIGLTEKLGKPTQRNLTTANDYWKGYLKANTSIQCIYSNQNITLQNVSLDHFIPWSYVAHDRLWNIIPTSKNINSAKNDKLPDTELYFDKFSELQYHSFIFYIQKERFKLLEDYSLLFHEELKSIAEFTYDDFKNKLQKQIFPQLEIAKNMGFSPFIYLKKE